MDKIYSCRGIANRCIEGLKKGIYVRFPISCRFADKEKKKNIMNRILATYVINHCIKVLMQKITISAGYSEII